MAYDIQDFQQEVIQKSHEKPVLVDFWAEWCGPCKVLGPVLEKLAGEFKEEWVLAKVDTEQHQELAMQYGIRGIPSVKLFVDGEIIDEFTGAMSEPMIRQWLEKAMPSKHRDTVARAYRLLAENDIPQARSLLEEVIRAEPGNTEARALLAKILLFSDPESAQVLAEQLAGSDQHDLAETLSTFITLFKRMAAPETLPEAKNKATYIQAIKQLKQQDFGAALRDFITVLELDRYYDDDGPRKAIISIFKFLGEDHDLTREYRPIFSRALYS